MFVMRTQVLEATPSPSSGTSRVGTPPVNTTPDVIVASSSVGVPSPADSDADTGPTPVKRPRLRSTKSELFIVNSELSRDTTTDTDGSCDAHAVGQSVASLVTAISDDSVDSTSVADVSQNSVTTADTGPSPAKRPRLHSTDVVTDDHLSSIDTQSTAVQVR